jgi:hypothetical protein
VTVQLRASSDLGGIAADIPWIAVTGTAPPAGRGAKLADAPRLLEQAFDAIRDEWWGLGKALGATPSAEWAHAPTCASYGSDLGIMLAWTRLADDLGKSAGDVLMVCDDPWLFRHLAGRPGIEAGQAPALWPKRIGHALRGIAARGRLAVHLLGTNLVLRGHRRRVPTAAPTLVVYGHPASRADGWDAYFGDLMDRLSGLNRLLHTDCRGGRARHLSAGGRASSLHPWGEPAHLLALPFTRWRPSANDAAGPLGWLVRRAAVLEGGRAAAAATRWQIGCQEAWLKARRPPVVAWPWENHPWERALVRTARRLGIATVGYQHTVIGRHMYNQSPASNPDGLAGLPDVIVCNGPAYRRQLEAWGVPADRLAVGGAFRLANQDIVHDVQAPVFVALSSDTDISAQMMAAVRALGPTKRRFVVKDHPMYPFEFAETETLRRTTRVLPRHRALSGVLYSTGTVGLEALLAGLPTFRFRPEGRIAIDILPDGVAAVPVDAESLEEALATARPPQTMDRGGVMAAVDLAVWRRYLMAGGNEPSC